MHLIQFHEIVCYSRQVSGFFKVLGGFPSPIKLTYNTFEMLKVILNTRYHMKYKHNIQ